MSKYKACKNKENSKLSQRIQVLNPLMWVLGFMYVVLIPNKSNAIHSSYTIRVAGGLLVEDLTIRVPTIYKPLGSGLIQHRISVSFVEVVSLTMEMKIMFPQIEISNSEVFLIIFLFLPYIEK